MLTLNISAGAIFIAGLFTGVVLTVLGFVIYVVAEYRKNHKGE